MPSLTSAMLKVRPKLQKPPMSLKQFMLRTEVLKLYRGFLRLGRLIEKPPESLGCNNGSKLNTRNLHPLQVEWIEWVRAEFRLREATTDEEATRMMLAHGKRQLQEMERTILLATNRNASSSVLSSSTSETASNGETSKCKVKK